MYKSNDGTERRFLSRSLNDADNAYKKSEAIRLLHTRTIIEREADQPRINIPPPRLSENLSFISVFECKNAEFMGAHSSIII
jgi:hypothetical protein